jgi:predicted dinucleotide-utilizing enzyme
MLMNAYNALGGVDGLHNIVLSGVPYINITARQEPTDIGLDAAQRIMFVFNIDAEKKPS